MDSTRLPQSPAAADALLALAGHPHPADSLSTSVTSIQSATPSDAAPHDDGRRLPTPPATSGLRAALPSSKHFRPPSPAVLGGSWKRMRGDERPVTAVPSAVPSSPSRSDDGDEAADSTHLEKRDGVYRCAWKRPDGEACGWEVSEGVCEGCGKRWMVGEEMADIDEELARQNDSLLSHPDRDPPSSSSHPFPSSDDCGDSTLLSSGCTPAMLDRFSLAYSPSAGIVLTADRRLRNRFDVHPRESRSDGGEGKKLPWEIHLGRYLSLAPDDEDGTAFLDALLNEVLDSQAGLGPKNSLRWVTMPDEYEVEVAEDSDDSAAEEGGQGAGVRRELRVRAWVTRRADEGETFFENEGASRAERAYDCADPFIDDGSRSEGSDDTSASPPEAPLARPPPSAFPTPTLPLHWPSPPSTVAPSSPFIDPDFDDGAFDPDLDDSASDPYLDGRDVDEVTFDEYVDHVRTETDPTGAALCEVDEAENYSFEADEGRPRAREGESASEVVGS